MTFKSIKLQESHREKFAIFRSNFSDCARFSVLLFLSRKISTADSDPFTIFEATTVFTIFRVCPKSASNLQNEVSISSDCLIKIGFLYFGWSCLCFSILLSLASLSVTLDHSIDCIAQFSVQWQLIPRAQAENERDKTAPQVQQPEASLAVCCLSARGLLGPAPLFWPVASKAQSPFLARGLLAVRLCYFHFSCIFPRRVLTLAVVQNCLEYSMCCQ